MNSCTCVACVCAKESAGEKRVHKCACMHGPASGMLHYPQT